MICESCGAKLDLLTEKNCPYCGSSIPNLSTNEKHSQVVKADAPRSLHRNPIPEGATGTVKVILKSSNNPLSPACGSTYIMNLNDGKYQIKLELMEFDTDSTIRVPYGSYNSYLEYFGYSDTTLVNPSIEKKNNKNFTIDANHNVELVIEVGTLIKSQKVTLNYV